MESYFVAIITCVTTVAASSGFWAFLQARREKKSGLMKLVKGLAHNEIVDQGMRYIERGWITKAEYDDFSHYIYKPYEEMGGNGLAERVYREVQQLPIRTLPPNNNGPVPSSH